MADEEPFWTWLDDDESCTAVVDDVVSPLFLPLSTVIASFLFPSLMPVESVLVKKSLVELAARASLDSISMDTRLSKFDLDVKSLETLCKSTDSIRTEPFFESLASMSPTIRSPRKKSSD